jgi:hypothetical protein
VVAIGLSTMSGPGEEDGGLAATWKWSSVAAWAPVPGPKLGAGTMTPAGRSPPAVVGLKEEFSELLETCNGL